MALLTKSGGFTSPTSTGNFDVTGIGFQPTGIIVYHEGGPDTIALASMMGFADAAGNQVVNFTIATGRDANNAARRSMSNKFISRTSAAGGIVSEATVSMLADGFRLNFTTAARSWNFRYIAFKDVPIKVGMFTASTATSATGSVTGMSFKPAAMIGMWLAGSSTASSALGYGLVDSALKQYSSGGNNNSGTDSLYYSEANFISVYSPTGYAGRMMVTSLNNDGFSYLTGAAGSAFDYGYFAIGGVQSNLVDVLMSAASSGLSFVLKLVWLASARTFLGLFLVTLEWRHRIRETRLLELRFCGVLRFHSQPTLRSPKPLMLSLRVVPGLSV